jgi:hypothetical protein
MPSCSEARAKFESGSVIQPLAHHEKTTMATTMTSVDAIVPGDHAPIPIPTIPIPVME